MRDRPPDRNPAPSLDDGPGRLLDGLDRSLPALERAMAVQRRCASVGFDWNDPAGARAKVDEELAELDEAIAEGDPEAIRSEVGDLILAVTNLARLLDVEPSEALQDALDRFQERFALVEDQVHASGRTLQQVDLETLEAYWQAAKRTIGGRRSHRGDR